MEAGLVISEQPQTTPLPIVALVSRVATGVVDHVLGDRSDAPLLVASACVEALKTCGIQAQAMYGEAAWVEVLENHTPVWTGFWDGGLTFWVATKFGECVDLSASVAHRQRGHRKTLSGNAAPGTLYGPPLLWSAEVPSFYRYRPEGVAQVELTESADVRKFERVMQEVAERCSQGISSIPSSQDELEFPNEPIICPGRKILDDSRGTFKFYDRALAVRKIPPSPF